MAALAQVRLTQNRNDDAVALREQRYKVGQNGEKLFSLAEALKHAGREKEAEKAFADFEPMSLKESNIGEQLSITS